MSWGLYVSQFTFFVGMAASAVMVAVPYYLHNFKAFGPLMVLAEALAIAALVAAGLFVLVDLGQPGRVLNVHQRRLNLKGPTISVMRSKGTWSG